MVGEVRECARESGCVQGVIVVITKCLDSGDGYTDPHTDPCQRPSFKMKSKASWAGAVGLSASQLLMNLLVFFIKIKIQTASEPAHNNQQMLC